MHRRTVVSKHGGQVGTEKGWLLFGIFCCNYAKAKNNLS